MNCFSKRINIKYKKLSYSNGQPKLPYMFMLLWAILLFFGAMFNYLEINKSYVLIFSAKLFSDPDNQELSDGFSIYTPGCKIRRMDPFDISVRPFIYRPADIVCNSGIPPLFHSNLTSLFLNDDSLMHYNVSDFWELNCCYSAFWRRKPDGEEEDVHVVYDAGCNRINETKIDIDSEFIRVTCEDQSNYTLYEDYFAFVPLKSPKIKNDEIKNRPINILVLGLDSVSRTNLYRQLPNSTNYIKRELNAFELFGYNKVADNTFVNLMPVLTGQFESELKNSCWPDTSSRFDNCPFLWNDFKKLGYTTAFGEDCTNLGMFNFCKNGFFNQPTDYYFTSFNRELEGRIGTFKDYNCLQCAGSRQVYKVTLDYVKNFAQRMTIESQPYFGFFWTTTLSHDYLNPPALGDSSFLNLFQYLKEEGHLENTILIFMSDHGLRWGDIRQTYQGQLEERLPFVFMYLPQSFQSNYPRAVKNLEINTRRLTTPFDLHETLKDFLDLDVLSRGKENNISAPRGYSFFSEIPEDRTCEGASIDSHWCTCQKTVEVAVNDASVIRAANYTVNHINNQLTEYSDCANLVLDTVLHARALYYNNDYVKELKNDHIKAKAIKDYLITFRTLPGEAIFEATVREYELQKNIVNDTFELKPSEVTPWITLNITGTVSRLNIYREQSQCMDDFHLKLYCYCKDLIKYT